MTELLYQADAYIRTFSAKVLSCTPTEGGFAVLLDRTAFFPEQGGQYADTGMLGEVRVLDVQLQHGEPVHLTDGALPVGEVVKGSIDFETRYDRMQNHTGEHLISGAIHTLYGYDNVGFHLADDDLTLDVNGVLDLGQLRAAEARANAAVYADLPVEISYPAGEVLAALDYRSKLDLTENVRIVTIAGYDSCACCAPHVARTGEIGMIKILDAIHYKGGMRIHLACGRRALADYNEKYDNISAIARELRVKQSESAAAVQRLLTQLSEQKTEIGALRRELVQYKIAALPATEGNLCLFETGADNNTLRAMVNLGKEKCGGICAAFSGTDQEGYQFVIGSDTIPLRARAKEITGPLNGRGGGTDQMISGTVRASMDEIRACIDAFRSIVT